MRVLLTQYYIVASEDRQLELDKVLLNNINNPLLDRIVLFTQKDSKHRIPKEKKIKIVKMGKTERLSYGLAIDWAEKKLRKDDIIIIANSDIYFDQTLTLIDNIIKPSKNIGIFLARYDVQTDGSAVLFNKDYTQDTWIMPNHFILSKEKRTILRSVYLGILGCDNRIAYEFISSGYKIINCPHSIKTYHLHNIPYRTYTKKDRYPGPYSYIPFTQLH